MAYAVEITISTGNKVSVNYQSQEVNVSVTYQLERGDTDFLALVAEKSAEVALAHHCAWEGVRAVESGQKRDATSPPQARPACESVELASFAQQTALRTLLAQSGWSEEEMQREVEVHFGVSTFEQLSLPQATTWLLELQKLAREKAHQKIGASQQINGHST